MKQTMPIVWGPVLFLGTFFGLQHFVVFDFWWGLLFAVACSSLWVAKCAPEMANQLLQDVQKGFIWKTAVGLLSAVVLYAVFWAGGWMLEQLFSESRLYIDDVYQFKAQTGVLRIVLSMIVIGAAEEWIWRQGVQRALVERMGGGKGVPLAVLFYAAVHLPTGNPVLILAALCCGFFWALLYAGLKSPYIVIVSHIAWDLAVFLVRPL